MGLRSSKDERVEYNIGNKYLDNPVDGFGLITNLIMMPKIKEETTDLLEKLNKLIHYDFITISKLDNMPNEAEMYEQLIKVYEEIEDLVEFSALANKNVVAVGGRFSSGKSLFLNSIINDEILPTDTLPTTSIPTYIISGDKEALYALNTFNHKAIIDREAIKALCHTTNSFIDKYNASFNHIIKIITIELTSFPFDNITFLDTPGYSKSESMIAGDNTDEKKAREHLKAADHIMWLIDITANGTISDTDIEFIKSLDFERPIFYILNKADQITAERVKEIYNKTKEDLEKNYLPFAGIVAYNSFDNNSIMGDNLVEFLNKVNGQVKHTHIKMKFEKIFNEFIDYNLKEQKNANELMPLLNEIPVSLAGLEVKNKDIFDKSIKKLIENNKSNMKRENRAIREFENLKNKFIDIIDSILDKIKIKDEKKTDRGPQGILKSNKEELTGVKLDDAFEAKVTRVSLLGVSIKSDKFKDSIIITPDEVTRFFNKQPKDIFKIDSKCKIEVIDIKYDVNEIKFSVIPK